MFINGGRERGRENGRENGVRFTETLKTEGRSSFPAKNTVGIVKRESPLFPKKNIAFSPGQKTSLLDRFARRSAERTTLACISGASKRIDHERSSTSPSILSSLFFHIYIFCLSRFFPLLSVLYVCGRVFACTHVRVHVCVCVCFRVYTYI